jgi:hypothetical protein
VQVRILDVLLSVQEREERAAMLSDAFTPPGSTAGEPPWAVLCFCWKLCCCSLAF